MSKKSQTTGLPKRRKRRASASRTPTNVENVQPGQSEASYKSRAEREVQLQKWAVRGVAAIVLVLIALVAVTFAVEQLIVPSQVLAVVNSENITVGQFRDEYHLERNRLLLQLNQLQTSGFDIQQLAQQEPYQTWLNEVNVPDQLGLRVINDMVDDRLLAQEAASRNITVNQVAVRAEVEAFFGFDPTEIALIGVEPTATLEPTPTPSPFVSPTPSPTATATPTLDPEAEQEVIEPTLTPQPTVVEPTLSPDEVRQNFADSEQNFRSYFERAGVAESAVNSFFERMALESLLTEDISGDDSSLLYADARHILVESEEASLEALQALQNGESFADLARAISTDTGSGYRGGELGEAYVGNYVPEFRQAIETAEIGELTGPVESEFGFHIIQVRSKEERNGAALEAQIERAEQQEFDRFVKALREDNADSFEISDSWLDYVPRS